MSFNPATFNAANFTPAKAAEIVQTAVTVQALEQAAARFALRRDNFAAGKSDICLDMAAKLQRFGSFVSEKQAGFAAKLIEWSQPRPYSAVIEATVKPPVAVTLPRLFDLMQRLAKLRFDGVTIARKNGDSLCWIKVPGVEGVVGKIEGGVVSIFGGRLRNTLAPETLLALLQAIEADPERAAVLYGKASGNCSICGRDLTDPESIERGIGPICAGKF